MTTEHHIHIDEERYQVVCQDRYEMNGAPVIEIIDSEGCLAGIISICLLELLPANETAISGDVPQADVIANLEKIGFVKNTGKFQTSGYGRYPIVEVLHPPVDEH